MQIESLVPDREVRWLVVEAFIDASFLRHRDEWVGTRIVFQLTPQDGGNKTRLDFEHIGLTPAFECFKVCNAGWNQFLGSLQSLVETGQGQPFVAAQPASDTDRIERSTHIQAPRARVWRALSNAEEYGSWFGANLTGQTFAPGQQVRGPLTIKGFEHVVFDAIIERMEPEHLLSYRWHPYAVDPAIDYSKEQRTLVTFTLKDAAGGTLLNLVESGFDQVPPEHRLTALRMNTQGWEGRLWNILRYATAL